MLDSVPVPFCSQYGILKFNIGLDTKSQAPRFIDLAASLITPVPEIIITGVFG